MVERATKLAIEGGIPTHTGGWPKWPVWDEREEQMLLDVLRSGQWGMNNGQRVREFEKRWATFQEAAYCVCVTNGTCALELSLRALGIGWGDEVIVPSYTFVATATAVLMVGALPVFVDIDRDTYGLDAEAAAAAVTSRTKAVIPVHIAGCPADMDDIVAVARRHDLAVLEDAAQAHGAAWRGQRVGAIGDLGTFSFQASKNINAGEGGAIVTNSERLYQMVWSLHNVGRIQTPDWRTRGWYEHEILGTNARMTEFQAALLLAQLTRVEEQMAHRERAARYLDQHLAEIPGIRPLQPDARVTSHAHHLYIFRYDASAFGGHPRAEFLAALYKEGIPCSSGYGAPLHHAPAVVTAWRRLSTQLGRSEQLTAGALPVAERAGYEEAVWLSQQLLLAPEADLAAIPEAICKIQRAWGG